MVLFNLLFHLQLIRWYSAWVDPLYNRMGLHLLNISKDGTIPIRCLARQPMVWGLRLVNIHFKHTYTYIYISHKTKKNLLLIASRVSILYLYFLYIGILLIFIHFLSLCSFQHMHSAAINYSIGPDQYILRYDYWWLFDIIVYMELLFLFFRKNGTTSL